MDHETMITIIALVASTITASAVWNLASPCFDSAFRSLFPRTTIWLAGTAILTTLAALGSALLVPWIAIFFGVLVTTLFALSLTRDLLGKLRHEPPGDRAIAASTRDLAHRDAYQRRFDRYGPLTVSSQFGRTVVCVLGIERGQRLLREHRDAIGPSPLAFSQQMMGGFLRYMDDETHDFYGPLFRRGMSRAVTEVSRPTVVRLVERELASITAEGIDPRPGIARVTEGVLLRSLFGVDPDSQFGEEFLEGLKRFGSHAIHHRANRSANRDLETVRSLVHTAQELSEASGAVCALSEIRALEPTQPDGVTVDNLLFMWRIGASNTASLLTWTLQHLGTNPEIRRRLVDPQPGLSEAIVMEALRLSQSEYVYRRLKKDTEFEGFHLRKGWMIRVCVAESHVDESKFVCPHEFSDRFLGERPSQTVYSPFGFDRHACNAGGLASMIVAIAIETMFSDPRVEVVPSQSVTRDLRHWSHWRPGPELGIKRATN